MDGKPWAKKSISSVRLNIYYINFDLVDLDVSLEKLFVRVVGVSDKTFFWNDIWCGPCLLKDKFPNIYDLNSNKKLFYFRKGFFRG